ncbi:hypothetical protein LO762_26090 [Actinocorallia sp. API 0066]|uniref:hypothetical protein n=1 Tax=Actinocorallia sp. API 0066 TaxID=2896846 RepID=UPI001E3E1FA8|nr:hypothetical protein [Actinocorallia sp. API 0066]MCD0452627.1 hypothetical protein [Actinocorallia sp. API 0066]
MTYLISAEVLAVEGRERAAAAALRDLGFRILHGGGTISVSGPKELWERTFGTTGNGRREIPAELAGLVRDVYVVEPPEFF